MKRWLIYALLLTGACGCGKQYWAGGDPELYGIEFEVAPDVDTSIISDFKEHLKNTLKRSSEFMGHDPKELAGLKIVLVANVFNWCTGAIGSSGCYKTPDNVLTIAMPSGIPDVGTKTYCIERTTLTHELVHYFHDGDPDHQSPEFRLWYFTDLWKELMTYAGGECAKYADVYSGFWAGPAMQP